MKRLGHPPEVFLLLVGGLLATGYGLALLSVKIVSLVAGLCSLLLAWNLAVRSRREPAPATLSTEGGEEPADQAAPTQAVGAPVLRGSGDPWASDIVAAEEPDEAGRLGSNGGEQEPMAAELEFETAEPEPTAAEPEPTPAEPKPSAADLASMGAEPGHPAEETEPAPMPEEATTPPQPVARLKSPAAGTPLKAAPQRPLRLRVEATTYQEGLPPRQHKIHVRMGSRGRRSR